MGIELVPGQPSYEARNLGCTCTWLREFGVGPHPEVWAERIIWHDPACPLRHPVDFCQQAGEPN